MGNECCETPPHCPLPDALLLRIFAHLEAQDLLHAACVCTQWLRVSHDHSLWTVRFAKDFRPRRCSPTPAHSALLEYRRLTYEAPVRLAQVLTHHSDEVLHVCFAPHGRCFSTASKDSTVSVWRVGQQLCEHMCSENMHARLYWKYTQLSAFNSEGNLLLVSGVHYGGENNTSGEIAVFEVDEEHGRLMFRCRVLNKPYDVFGCWFDSRHVLSGELLPAGHAGVVSQIWLSKATQDAHNERTSVLTPLFKIYNRNSSTVRMLLVGSYVEGVKRHRLYTALRNTQVDRMTDSSSSESEEPSTSTSARCDCCKDRVQAPQAPADDSDSSMTSCACVCHVDTPDRLLIFTNGSLTFTPHQVAFKLVRTEEVMERLYSDIMPEERRQRVYEAMRERREERARLEEAQNAAAIMGEMMGVQPDGADDVEEEELVDRNPADDIDWNALWDEMDDHLAATYDQPDHVLEMHGHIVGMALSQDHKQLLVNVRQWPTGATISDPMTPPPIAQQIELRVIDLTTLQVLTDTPSYEGHMAFTPAEQCFFIFLDSVGDWLASGSEDKHGYVWSAEHNSVVGRLPHANVVNCVSFSPTDPGLLVTASDDKTVKVWRSREFMHRNNLKTFVPDDVDAVQGSDEAGLLGTDHAGTVGFDEAGPGISLH